MGTLRFVLESPRDPRAAEVVAALEHERVDGAPAPVLVAPAEAEGRALQTQGAVLLAAHRPGTPAYDATVRSPPSGPMFVLDAGTQRALRYLGVASELLPIGPSPCWQADAGERRDLDIVVVDRMSGRRARALALCAARLARWRCALHLLDELSTPVDPAPLLACARVVLLLHEDAFDGFPRVRAVQAAMNGCAVVAEHSSDAAPFVAGEHYLSGRPASLALLAEVLLEDEARRRSMVAAAHGVVASMPTMAAAAALLARRCPPVDVTTPPRAVLRESSPARATPNGGDGSALKAARLAELCGQREAVRADRVARGLAPDADELLACTPAWESAAPEISVLVTVYDHEQYVEAALDSAIGGGEVQRELVIVDDASRDGSAEVVADWIERHPDTAARFIRHAVNRGLPQSRNTALAHARGHLVFVLDSDNEIYPSALERLADALRRDPGADFAYPLQEVFGPGGTIGLRSVHDWNPERFRENNFIDAMALVRRETLLEIGGYCTDDRLYGWEDYDLWCAIAERGGRGIQVPEILGRYRVAAGGSMLSLTDLSHASAREALRERHPRTMGSPRSDNSLALPGRNPGGV